MAFTRYFFFYFKTLITYKLENTSSNKNSKQVKLNRINLRPNSHQSVNSIQQQSTYDHGKMYKYDEIKVFRVHMSLNL